MEFHEKLQELRKNRGITQEELAEELYVSRTAVSKWESGRGYPSIDSLKAISNYFSVTIDDLLSGEKLIFIAEKENDSNIRSLCELLFGIVDVCTFLLIILPLYPKRIEGYVYSVNLFAYTEGTVLIRLLYWIIFVVLIGLGITKVVLLKIEKEKNYKVLTDISMVLHILTIFFLAATREAYTVMVAFLLLVIKTLLVCKEGKMKQKQ